MKAVALAVSLLLISCAGFAQITITITTPSTLPSGSTGTPYSQTLAATGGVAPYTWSVTSGALPDGLALSSAGVIAGIPLSPGTSTFSVTVSDASTASASQSFSLTISLAALAITTPATLPAGFTGASYSQTLAAIGGIPPYTWSITSGALPAGLAMSSDGVIAGIPTAAGNSAFTVSVSYGILFASQAFTLTIGGVSPAITTPATLPLGSTGAAYSETLAATGGAPPYTWSILAGALPPGLALSSAGVIAGTPTAIGAYVFTAQAQDSASLTASQAFSLTVTAPGALSRVGVISQLAEGGGWDTTIWLINRSSAQVQASLIFHGDDGSPLSLPVTVTGPGVSLLGTVATVYQAIAANTTLVVATAGSASLVQGWVDVLSSGPLSGFAVFRDAGAAEAAVPLQSQIGNSISLPFDNTGGNSTGVALVNLSGLPASITATVWDVNGNQLAAQPVALTKTDSAGNGHDAFMLPDRVAGTAGQRGIVQFQGSPGTPFVPAAALTGLGLKADANGSFTSIPTIVP